MSRKIVVQKLNKKYGALLKRIWRCMPLYIMMVPGICYLVINNYLPLTGLQLALVSIREGDLEKSMEWY